MQFEAAPRAGPWSAIRAEASAVRRWAELGWYDFLYAHRRTLIGPLWETLQLAIWATAIIWIFGRFHSDDADYIPYVVTGLVGWVLLSSVLGQGVSVFTSNASLIQNVPNPLFYYVVRSLSRLLARFGFQFLVFVPVGIYFSIPVNANTLLFFPMVLLVAIASTGVMTVLGIACARIRDLENVVSALLRFLFFVTPIFWVPGEGSVRMLSMYNPAAYALEVIRAPLLGQAPSMLAYCVVGGGAVLALIAAAFALKRYGRYVPLWL